MNDGVGKIHASFHHEAAKAAPKRTKRSSGAGAIVETLIDHGVDTVFGMPGVQTYELFEAFRQAQDKIRVIGTRHEQGAGYMAFGYARSTGKLGVCSVVPGPGILNAAAALNMAEWTSTPLLAVSGQIPSSFIGEHRGHLHEMYDQLATMQSFLKNAQRIESPALAPAMVADAIGLAMSGRPGVVEIEMAMDVMSEVTDVTFGEYGPAYIPSPAPDTAELDKAVDILKSAKSPMILVGGGAVNAGAEILELAELLEAPTGANRMGKGILSDRHDLSVCGYAAYRLWEETDVVIGIGSRLEMPYMRWCGYGVKKPRARSPKLIRIEVNPVDLVRLPAEAGICAEAKVGVRALIDALIAEGVRTPPRRAAAMATQKSVLEKVNAQVQPQMGFLNVIRDVLPDDGFFVEEVSQFGFAAQSGFPVYNARHYISCGAQGTLGFGFQTALGVKVGNPDKQVVSVTGDGGFMFGLQEMASAVEHGINLVTIVVNNGGYGNVRRDQKMRFGGQDFKSALHTPDFQKLADAFGVRPYLVATNIELQRALEKAFGANEPSLIEIRLGPDDEQSPWPFLFPGGY